MASKRAPFSEEERQKYRDGAESFLSSGHTTRAAYHFGMKFHELNPPMVSEEEDREKERQDMAQRWELVRAVEKIIRRIPEHETDGINFFNLASIICGNLEAISFYIEFGHSTILLNNGANTESLLANCKFSN